MAQSYYNKNLLPILSALLSVELTHLPNKQLFSVGQVCVWFHELTYKLTCTHTNTRVYARTHARARAHTHTLTLVNARTNYTGAAFASRRASSARKQAVP